MTLIGREECAEGRQHTYKVDSTHTHTHTMYTAIRQSET